MFCGGWGIPAGSVCALCLESLPSPSGATYLQARSAIHRSVTHWAVQGALDFGWLGTKWSYCEPHWQLRKSSTGGTEIPSWGSEKQDWGQPSSCWVIEGRTESSNSWRWEYGSNDFWTWLLRSILSWCYGPAEKQQCSCHLTSPSLTSDRVTWGFCFVFVTNLLLSAHSCHGFPDPPRIGGLALDSEISSCCMLSWPGSCPCVLPVSPDILHLYNFWWKCRRLINNPCQVSNSD
jgi:hypothetical protein